MRLNFTTVLEDLQERAVFNDVDLDYLNHLKVDIPTEVAV
jgi:hypothetical protein